MAHIKPISMSFSFKLQNDFENSIIFLTNTDLKIKTKFIQPFHNRVIK